MTLKDNTLFLPLKEVVGGGKIKKSLEILLLAFADSRKGKGEENGVTS